MVLHLYSNNSCKKCLKNNEICKNLQNFDSHKESIVKFSYNYGKFIKEFKKEDILITGYELLSCIMHVEFNKIMSVHIKNIDKVKILNFDKKIRKLYSNKKIVYVKEPLNIIWLVCDEKYKTELQINLNIVIYETWEEMFENQSEDYHCVGYSMLNNKILQFKSKWEKFMVDFNHKSMDVINSKQNYDLSDLDVGYSLWQQCPLFVTTDIYNIINKLRLEKYCDINVDKISKQIELMEELKGENCCILLQNASLFLTNKMCCHKVSLRSYLKCKINKCLFCRKPFECGLVI